MLYVTVMDILSVQFEIISVSVMFPPFNGIAGQAEILEMFGHLMIIL